MMKKLLAMLVLAAGGAQAQQVLSGDEFDTLSRGTTMYFTANGAFYGAEQFLPDRRTVWRAQDGSCVNGQWVVIDRDICFYYDGEDRAFCWQITSSDSGISVTSTQNTPGEPPLVLKLAGQDTVPILCTGPRFGV